MPREKKQIMDLGPDHRTGRTVYPSMFAAGKALAEEFGGDPADQRVWFMIQRTDPDRFRWLNPETNKWEKLPAPARKTAAEKSSNATPAAAAAPATPAPAPTTRRTAATAPAAVAPAPAARPVVRQGAVAAPAAPAAPRRAASTPAPAPAPEVEIDFGTDQGDLEEEPTLEAAVEELGDIEIDSEVEDPEIDLDGEEILEAPAPAPAPAPARRRLSATAAAPAVAPAPKPRK